MFLKFKINNLKFKRGFSLTELIVGVAVFLVIVVGVYNAYKAIFDVVYTSRAKIDAVDLINEQLEIVRNMQYADVGIVSGIPAGVLLHSQTITRGASTFSVLTTVRNVDDPFDGTLGGTPNDTSPADFKTVEIEVTCAPCRNFKPMVITTRVAPKNLENTSLNGALFVKVFDANGNPIPDAAVHIENNIISPKIVVDDVTNVSGMLQIVDVPTGVNAYEVNVTKTGYSTDKTYTINVGNPHPTKPHATVAKGQVTQLSFVIDKLSTFNVTSQSETCAPVSSMDFSLVGSKTVGTNPIVYKYSQNKITDSNGQLTIPNIEWDSYTLSNIDTVYDFIGLNPLSPVSLSPNSSQNIGLIVAPKAPKTLLIAVKDSSTGLPLTGVSVEITKTGLDITKITGQGFLGQTDWSGGGGQATSTDKTKYFSSDGSMEIASPVGDVILKKVLGQYLPSGQLISSSFDTLAQSNYGQINWNPTSEPVNSNVRFQIATNNDGATWNFIGPDGTSGTYYTTANKNISSNSNGKRYFRYKLFLDTTATSTSPNISDVSVTFTLSCTPPGQVYFSGLIAGTYIMTLSKSGYIGQTGPITISSDWQMLNITMSTN